MIRHLLLQNKKAQGAWDSGDFPEAEFLELEVK